MTALTIAFTVLRIPRPPSGYVSLADVMVYFSAFAFGPLVGGLSAGLGTGLADLINGYPQWMILSFLIHGLQGVVAAVIAKKGTLLSMVIGMMAGLVVMVGGYFAATAALYGIGVGIAEILANAIQAFVGGMMGIPLVLAVKKAYPPLLDITKPRSWEEE